MKKISDLIIDIGKSNIKFVIFDKKNGTILKKKLFKNNYLKNKKNFKQIDHDKILNLIKRNIKLYSKEFNLKSIMPITHGSVILLLNKNQKILECISDESYLGNKIDTIYKNKVLKIKNAYSPVLDY